MSDLCLQDISCYLYQLSIRVNATFYPKKDGRHVPNFFNVRPSPYDEGYRIEEFGPTKFLRNKEKKAHITVEDTK
jgi:hypothetical protein